MTVRPYFEDDAVTLYLGDALVLLPQIAVDVDVVVTDPPYGETSLIWDHRVDGWLDAIPGRSLWCFGSLRSFMATAPQFARAAWKLSQDVVWEKHNGSSAASSGHEIYAPRSANSWLRTRTRPRTLCSPLCAEDAQTCCATSATCAAGLIRFPLSGNHNERRERMWADLEWLGLQVRPLSDLRPEVSWQRSRFQAPLRRTVRQLATELRALDARHIILELDLRDRDIRMDGYPRADARTGSPAVVLSFDSKYGPLRYATGEYDDWRDNLRAITLSMESLRAVDRYGVSKRGEQYRGWKALMPSSDPADSLQTEAQARAFLDEHYDGSIRRALFDTHPDRGGDADAFRKVQRARELLGA